MSGKQAVSRAVQTLAAVKTAISVVSRLRRESKAAKAGVRQLKDQLKVARKHHKQARKAARAAEDKLDAVREVHRAAMAAAATAGRRARAARQVPRPRRAASAPAGLSLVPIVPPSPVANDAPGEVEVRPAEAIVAP